MNRTLSILLSLFVLFAGVQSLGAQVPDDEEDPYFLLSGQADKAIADGNYEEAAARLIDAISLKPESPSNALLLSNLGMIYSCLDRDSLAVSTLDKALEIAPGMLTALSNRARILVKMGRDKEAYRDFSSVLAADSANAEARFYHGTIALYGGNLPQAEADFAVLAKIEPEGFATASALSTLYSLTGRDREAIPYFRRLIATDPAPEYYASMAGCLLAVGDLSEAAATIAEGMKLFPDDPELYYYRAMLNRDRYRIDDAHADAERAVKLGLSPRKAKELFDSK